MIPYANQVTFDACQALLLYGKKPIFDEYYWKCSLLWGCKPLGVQLKTQGNNYNWPFFSLCAMLKLLTNVSNALQVFLGEQNQILHRQNASVGLISIDK